MVRRHTNSVYINSFLYWVTANCSALYFIVLRYSSTARLILENPPTVELWPFLVLVLPLLTCSCLLVLTPIIISSTGHWPCYFRYTLLSTFTYVLWTISLKFVSNFMIARQLRVINSNYHQLWYKYNSFSQGLGTQQLTTTTDLRVVG